MNSPKNYILLLLAATTVGGAVLAWRQYSELVELRAAAMNKDERADLQKRVWDLEKLNRELRDQFSAQRDPADPDTLLAAAADGERPNRDRGGRGSDPRGRGNNGFQQMTAIRELMNKPEVQAMINLQQKAAIDARYAALFKNLNLAPEQADKLKTLLAERATTMQDVMAAARDQGVNPRENPDTFRQLIANAQDQINNTIKSVIGDQGFAQLTNYEQTLPQRNLVNELQQRLSYTDTPLTAAQAEQMVQILAANSPQRQNTSATSATNQPGNPPAGGGFGGRGGDLGGMIAGVIGGGPGMGMAIGGFDGGARGGGATTPVTSAAVAQSQTVLTAPQVAALQQIQQQQQAQQQLRQLVNETLVANQAQNAATGGNPPTQGTAAGAPAPARRNGGG